MEGLFTDPNCTQNLAWATWLAGLDALTLGAAAAEPGLPEAGGVEMLLLGATSTMCMAAWQHAQRRRTRSVRRLVAPFRACSYILENSLYAAGRVCSAGSSSSSWSFSGSQLLPRGCYSASGTGARHWQAWGVRCDRFCLCTVEARQPVCTRKLLDARKASISGLILRASMPLGRC